VERNLRQCVYQSVQQRRPITQGAPAGSANAHARIIELYQGFLLDAAQVKDVFGLWYPQDRLTGLYL